MNHIESTFEEIIRWLQSTRALSATQAEQLLNADSATLDPQTETGVERAWYVKLFIGISAWIAATFLISGVSSFAFIIASDYVMVIVGFVLLCGAVALKWAQRQSIFWGQFAFALSLTGQGLFFGGLAQILIDFLQHSERVAFSQMALIIIATQILLLFIFPDTVHRLLSVIFASLGGIVLIGNELVDWTLPRDQRNEILGALPSLLLILFAVGVFLVWQNRTKFFASRWYELHSPIGYGLAIVLFGVGTVTLFFDSISGDNARLLWLASIGLALLLAHLAIQVVDEFSNEFSQPFLAKVGFIIAIGLLLVPLYETVGIWAALLALVLGFRHNHYVLIGLSSAFLLFFIGFYYYSLDITLLNKSYALIGSGLLLLLIRFVGGRVLGTNEQTGELSA